MTELQFNNIKKLEEKSLEECCIRFQQQAKDILDNTSKDSARSDKADLLDKFLQVRLRMTNIFNTIRKTVITLNLCFTEEQDNAYIDASFKFDDKATQIYDNVRFKLIRIIKGE